ncbi:TIGR04552 family protein [Fluviispira multicolorata]|uniref:TIGR04552 family protein n=1 Tax=Fluviispira multicolorata TaxID=2654512 RepID=A0A833JC38_9BACT|nr:TIGR04552 family protein [Fluviispira multicolorata]KAB8029767.1 TIGR04552 family protein [Fluviispira multicolorata]
MKESLLKHTKREFEDSAIQSNTTAWNIPWQEFEVILGLKNSYSQRNLNILTENQARIFLKNCGFDLTNQSHIKQFEQFYGEALYFIRHVLFTDEERTSFIIPANLLYLKNPCNLLIFASTNHPRKRYLRLWSCSILKVMYAISNLQYSGRLHIIDDAREQIFKRIRNYMHQHKDEKLEFKYKNDSIYLNKVEWKEAKTRTSIVLKLLHKPDSIVDDVFDYLGVRIVVEKSSKIPLLLKLLIETDIIIPHQVVAMRTRNSLLNVKHPKKIFTFLKELKSCGSLSNEEFDNMCENIIWSNEINDEHQKRTNSFTSQHYRSLQFTVRHLVRTPNPAFLVLESMTNQLRRYTGVQRQEPWMESVIPQYFAHYFPIEIQMMDQESYEMAKFGPASHEQYKSQQHKSVRERVLGNLLTFKKEKLASQDF